MDVQRMFSRVLMKSLIGTFDIFIKVFNTFKLFICVIVVFYIDANPSY